MMVLDEGAYRSLYFDNQMTQSRMALAHPLWLILPYTRHMLAALLFNNHPRHILMIGLGGGSLAKFFLHYFPACRMDVVDSNPKMASIAQQFFFLPTETRLTLYCADGESFVTTQRANAPSYDLILLDAFDHDGMAHAIYTDLFFHDIQHLLSDDGLLAFNVNRAEQVPYQQILHSMTHAFPFSIFRLPVPAPSCNEIIFCCKTAPQDTDWSGLQHQALAWADHQPPLDFVDFSNRMVPIKQATWQRWKNRFNRYWRRNRPS